MLFVSVLLFLQALLLTSSASATLVPRQIAGFDPSNPSKTCIRPCTIINNALAICSSLVSQEDQVNCICTAGTQNLMGACMKCEVGVSPATLDSTQKVMNNFRANCNKKGTNVLPDFSLSGNSSSSNSSTPNLSQTSAEGATSPTRWFTLGLVAISLLLGGAAA